MVSRLLRRRRLSERRGFERAGVVGLEASFIAPPRRFPRRRRRLLLHVFVPVLSCLCSCARVLRALRFVAFFLRLLKYATSRRSHRGIGYEGGVRVGIGVGRGGVRWSWTSHAVIHFMRIFCCRVCLFSPFGFALGCYYCLYIHK